MCKVTYYLQNFCSLICYVRLVEKPERKVLNRENNTNFFRKLENVLKNKLMYMYFFQTMAYRISVISCMVWLTLSLYGHFTTGVDLLPCTDNPSPADRQLAIRITRDHTPPGYNMLDLDSDVTMGRNPHRCIGPPGIMVSTNVDVLI